MGLAVATKAFRLNEINEPKLVNGYARKAAYQIPIDYEVNQP